MADRKDDTGPGAKERAERLRYDAQHRPVDRFGDVYGTEAEGGPEVEPREPGMGDDRPRAHRGTLDPYHRNDPGEASPDDSPARPKAPAAHEVGEDGRLVEPPRPKKR